MFHAGNYSNRDLKHENVMVGVDQRLWAVDMDGIRKKIRITRRRAARDLFRIGDCLAKFNRAEPPDVQAFFSGYNRLVPPRLRRHDFPARN